MWALYSLNLQASLHYKAHSSLFCFPFDIYTIAKQNERVCVIGRLWFSPVTSHLMCAMQLHTHAHIIRVLRDFDSDCYFVHIVKNQSRRRQITQEICFLEYYRAKYWCRRLRYHRHCRWIQQHIDTEFSLNDFFSALIFTVMSCECASEHTSFEPIRYPVHELWLFKVGNFENGIDFFW